jgi:hypothetical protein
MKEDFSGLLHGNPVLGRGLLALFLRSQHADAEMGTKMLYLRAQALVLFAQRLDYSVLILQAPLLRSTEYGNPGDHPGPPRSPP